MQEQTAILRGFLTTLNLEADLATDAVDTLRDRNVSDWPDAFDQHPQWVSFGSLNALLEVANDELDKEPRRARDIAEFVLQHAERISASPETAFFRPLLIGTAWKEKANALLQLDDEDGAMTAICRALEIFQGEPALTVDRAAALLVYAQIAQRQNATVDALEAVKEAAATFRLHRENRRYHQALEVCGNILFDQEQYEIAKGVFETARTVAETLDDPYAIARAELALGHIAIYLEKLDEATRYLTRALTYFEEKQISGAVGRAVWGIGRVARERDDFDEAIHTFHLVYGEFLHRGNPRAAASVLVELCDTVTRLVGDATFAREECQRLAETMGSYNVPDNVRDAMEYLRRETETGSASVARAAFARVREFLESLFGSPLAAFAVSS